MTQCIKGVGVGTYTIGDPVKYHFLDQAVQGTQFYLGPVIEDGKKGIFITPFMFTCSKDRNVMDGIIRQAIS